MIAKRVAASVIVMVGALVGAAGCPGTDYVQCAEGPHPRQKCDLAFRLDSQKIDGSLSIFNFGAKANTEGQVLRDVEKELKGYSFKQQQLCERWNACSISRDEYNRQTNLNTAVLDGVKLAADEYKVAKDTDNDRQQADALAKTVAYVLPDAQLDLEFSAIAMKPTNLATVPRTDVCPTKDRYAIGTEKVILSAGSPVPSGTHMYFTVRLNKPAYVYLYQKFDETGELRILYPHKDIPRPTNPIPANELVTIPPEDIGDYCLDEKNIGLERVFVVASLEPLHNLEAAAAKIEAGQYKQVPEMVQMDQIAAKSAPPVAGCKTRALSFEGKQGSCTRSRGLTFESKASKPTSGSSFKAKSEAGDTMIVKVFPFQHFASFTPPPGMKSRDIMIEQ